MRISRVARARRFVAAALIIPLLLWFTGASALIRQDAPDNFKAALKMVQLRGRIIVITYEITGVETDSYVVSFVLLREGEPQLKVPVSTASGDIGEGKFCGGTRAVIWDYGKDYPRGVREFGEDSRMGLASGYYVEMIVKKSRGGNLLYYVGGGIVLVAGVVALLIFGKKGAGATELPSAPSRPSN